MLYRIATHWRMVLVAVILVGLAAFALGKSVSVLAQGRAPSGGQPRQTVAAPAVAAPALNKGQAQPVTQAGQAPASGGAAPVVVQATPPAPSGTSYHTVQSGETLNKIAAQYGVTTKALAQANGITNADLIRVGQKLTIPSR